MAENKDVLVDIEENTRETKEAVAVGGDLYSRIDELVTAITDIQEGKSGGGNDIKQALALAIVAPSVKGVGMGLRYVVDAVNNLEGSGKEVTEKLEALVGGLTKLGDVGKSILLFAGYMLLATPLLLITAAASPIIAASLFVLIGGIMLATKFLDEERMEAIERLKDVGLGLLAFTGALVLISFVIPFALKGLLGAVVIIGVVALLTRLIPEKKVEQLEAFGKGMLNVALGIAAMAAVFALISFIIMPALTGALMALGIVAAIAGVFYLFDKFKLIKPIDEGSKAILLAAGAILGLGIALALFGIIAPPLKELLNIALVVGVVGLAFGIMGRQFGRSIEKGAKGLIFAAVAIVVLGLAINLFQKLTGNLTGEDAVRGLGALLFIGLVGAGFYLAGTQAKIIAKGAAAMILVGVSLVIIAIGTKIMSSALGDNGFELIGQIALLVGGLAVEMGLAGLAFPFIAAGAAAMILAGVALLSVAAGVAAMGKLNFKTGALAMSGQVTEPIKILGVKITDGGRPKTNMEVALEAVADSFSLNPIKIGAMYLGAPALIMAGMALITVATGIKKFQNIAAGGADLPSLGTNIESLVEGLSGTFRKVGEEMGGSLFFFSDVYKGIQVTRGMGKSLTSIAMGVQAMANLKFPTGFDKDGNPTGYQTIDVEGVTDGLRKNTKLLITSLTDVFADIGKEPDKERTWFFGKRNVEKGVELVAQFGMPLYNLSKGVQAMADLKFPKGFDKDGKPTGYDTIGSLDEIETKIGDNTKALVRALTGVFTTIGSENPNATSFWGGSTAFEKGIEIITMIAEPYQTLGNSVKGIVDTLGKLDTTTFTGKVKDLIGVFTQTEDDTDVMLIATRGLYAKRIGESFEKLGSSVPKIAQAIATFKTEQGRAFFGAFVGPVDEGDRANGYAQQNHMWKAIGSAMVKTKDSMPGITSAVNEMDMDKLVESRKMFEALAVLGEGGDPGDILAAMGESLEEALNNLADLLTEFRGTVEEGVTAQTEATGGLLGAVQSFIPGGGGGGGNQTVKVDNDEVVAAVKNLQSVLISQGIKVKSSGGFFS